RRGSGNKCRRAAIFTNSRVFPEIVARTQLFLKKKADFLKIAENNCIYATNWPLRSECEKITASTQLIGR
ncbi:hypothetical protein, partial [Paenibacillus phocaensis]|uniref:hypothetical protein n=1 Tax=Paenibacillus phocaensis TaxID=1776378 RepID=UPI001E6371E9